MNIQHTRTISGPTRRGEWCLMLGSIVLCGVVLAYGSHYLVLLAAYLLFVGHAMWLFLGREITVPDHEAALAAAQCRVEVLLAERNEAQQERDDLMARYRARQSRSPEASACEQEGF